MKHPVAVEILASASELDLSKRASRLMAEGWILDGPTTTAERLKNEEYVRLHGRVTLFIQRLVKYESAT